MKHAGTAALATLAPLLRELRALPALVERTPGSFYRRGQAYLHFHEDAAGLFVDVKLDGRSFERLSVNTTTEHAHLLSRVSDHLAAIAPTRHETRHETR